MIETVLAGLQGVRKSGNGYVACCPAHQDKRPSLYVSEDGGRVLVYCYAGCKQDEVIDALKSRGAWPSGQSQSTNSFLVAEYPYQDETGKLLYTIERMSDKQFYPRQPDGARNLQNVRRVLFRLPRVMASHSVVVVEGEKDVETIERLGLVGTTSPSGSSSWRKEYAESLRGKRIAILPDHDVAGFKYAAAVLDSLRGVAEWAAVVRLPILRKGGDVSDWMVERSDEDGRRELLDLIRQAKPWVMPELETSLVCLSEVEGRRVEFLWDPYIPLGKVTLIDGDPGVGKSWLTQAIATGISLGTLPGRYNNPGSVLLLSTEDDVADTIYPRLLSMRADRSRIFCEPEYFELDREGMERLDKTISRTKAVAVFLDPLVAYFGRRDLNKANETRAVMAALAEIAERQRCSIIGVRHLRKEHGTGGKALYRGTGSIDILGASRSVLMVQEDEDTGKRGSVLERKITHIKCNVAPRGPQMRYTVHAGKFYWISDDGEWTEPSGALQSGRVMEGTFEAKVKDGKLVMEPVDGEWGLPI